MAMQHYVMFTFGADVPPTEQKALVTAMEAFLRRQRYSDSWQLGIDLGLREGNASVVVIATFPDTTRFAEFQEDPAHLAVLAKMRPAIAHRSAIQVPTDRPQR